jgi:hypothetical protein
MPAIALNVFLTRRHKSPALLVKVFFINIELIHIARIALNWR